MDPFHGISQEPAHFVGHPHGRRSKSLSLHFTQGLLTVTAVVTCDMSRNLDFWIDPSSVAFRYFPTTPPSSILSRLHPIDVLSVPSTEGTWGPLPGPSSPVLLPKEMRDDDAFEAAADRLLCSTRQQPSQTRCGTRSEAKRCPVGDILAVGTDFWRGPTDLFRKTVHYSSRGTIAEITLLF
ncbi:hypothetical protein H6P81_019579 [Aristolochia fimbriata]|uniref:Uncharacterized protein n=1 Tax=Aristolochia fimbriata TaxID=158543 RepID=A0AAV7DSC7_ARIFI|nr:hypothetical protein H6P81_019579 [Aristolochia fimbriata]